MSHHDEVVKNDIKKELSVAMIGTLAFLAIVLLIGIAAFLRPAGDHVDVAKLNAAASSTAASAASTATVANADTATAPDATVANPDNATMSAAPVTAAASSTIAARNASTAEAKQEIAAKTGETPNIAPPVASATASDSTKADNKAGEALYAATCKTCHEAGIAGAPKVGDSAAWKARVAQGNDTLYKHAIEGFQGKAGMMPAKGGNTTASDADVKAAVDYMVSKSS